MWCCFVFFFQAEDGIRDADVTGVRRVLFRSGVVDGEPGWPQWEIHDVGGRTFPTRSRRPPIQVSAQWGWNAVPAPVHEAALVAGEEAFKLKGAPFGPAVRIDNNPHITKMLGRYQLDPIQSG